MKVVLMTEVGNLGALGDVVNVKMGYARNFLIPYGKALRATEESQQQARSMLEELARKKADELVVAKVRKKKLDGLEIAIATRVTEGGKMYGSVGATDIAVAVKGASGIEVHGNEIRLPDGIPIRETGVYEIEIAVYAEILAVIKLELLPQNN